MEGSAPASATGQAILEPGSAERAGQEKLKLAVEAEKERARLAKEKVCNIGWNLFCSCMHAQVCAAHRIDCSKTVI